jgi:hypothetical protein
VLGLSGWSGQSWTDSGSFDLLSDTAWARDELIAPVHLLLRNSFHATPKQIAATLNQPPELVWRACERLCRQGRAIFDVETRGLRHRELFEQPIDEAKFFPPDERLVRANALLAKNAVPFVRCEPAENRKSRRYRNPNDGSMMFREVIYRDWRVTGSVGSDKTEIVVGDPERIIFGTCTCAFFQENLLGKGPCEHMIALFKASADGRKDLPTSAATSSAGVAKPKSADDEEEGAEEGEEDFDENESDEKNEGR